MNLNQKPIIALDADGVLLHYNNAFKNFYELFFKVSLTIQDPNAYHATRYLGIDPPDNDSPFWKAFSDQDVWGSMPAIEGAIEACHQLKSLDFDLVCVTSMPVQFEHRRLHNLQILGFPIERVIATGRKSSGDVPETTHSSENPKKEVIDLLKPAWFVDDEWRKLKNIENVNLVMIDPGCSDSPNKETDYSKLTTVAQNLKEFAQWLTLQMKEKPISHLNFKK